MLKLQTHSKCTFFTINRVKSRTLGIHCYHKQHTMGRINSLELNHKMAVYLALNKHRYVLEHVVKLLEAALQLHDV